MDIKKAPGYTLELSADRSNIRDVVIGILHTIFFHRVFTTLQPATHDVLDTTLPYVSTPDDEIEETIEKRTNAFIRHIESQSQPPPPQQQSPQYHPKTPSSTTTAAATSTAGTARGQLYLHFLEKKRKKHWFVAKADEETVWETWVLDVTLSSARSEPEALRNRRQMESLLQKAAMRVIDVVNRDKGHIPPITTTETNPFPFQIVLGGRRE